MRDTCCWTNCDNPAGGGTHTMIDVPQIGADPMRVTLPVCEEHWWGNWHRERHDMRRQLSRLAALLRHGLEVIDGEQSDDSGTA